MLMPLTLKKRNNLTLIISYDNGIILTKQFVIDKSKNGKKIYTAYSDIVKIDSRKIRVFMNWMDTNLLFLTELNGNKG